MSNKKKEKVNLNRDQIFTHLDEELDSALNELAETTEKVDSILNEEELDSEVSEDPETEGEESDGDEQESPEK